MAGICRLCGFSGTNDAMENHAGEMCQGDFQPDDIVQNFNSVQQPLSGSPKGSPKPAEPTSDNGRTLGEIKRRFTVLVLRRKGTLDFICRAKTLDDLNKKINKCYWYTKGCKPKGSVFELSDYMENKVISELTVVDLTQSQLSHNKQSTRCYYCLQPDGAHSAGCTLNRDMAYDDNLWK